MGDEPETLTTLTVTERERRIIYRALTMSTAMLDALGDELAAATCVELAERVLPGGTG
jgi:hypothetical protein